MTTHEDYRAAAALLWGAAGALAADEFARINRDLFGGSIPPMPVIIGLTAFGRCIGLTGGGWLDGPRITLAPELFNGNHRTPGGRKMVADTLVHEMIHAALMFRGEDPSHNSAPWCRFITDLSPDVLGHEITARPVGTRRVPNPARQTDPGDTLCQASAVRALRWASISSSWRASSRMVPTLAWIRCAGR